MLPTRYGAAGPSSNRKSRLDKASLIPKPRQSGSTDRASSEMRRPSAIGKSRSSSADHPRATFSSRLSKDAPSSGYNSRARSQTQDSRSSQSIVTPLRKPGRSFLSRTPRTPTDDRRGVSLQTSIERAVAYVIVKDQRPISNPAWQRAEYTRVVEALSARMSCSTSLVRPLTITQFVNIVGSLLNSIFDIKLNNDNYVTKLPGLCKELLYPGTVAKSWLKTVNTLHAFPQALALIAYLLDLVTHMERPVLDSWLYVNKDEKAQLLRDYLHKCWMRFQDPEYDYSDLVDEYMKKLKEIVKYDENQYQEAHQMVKDYENTYHKIEEEAKAEQIKLAAKAERHKKLAHEFHDLVQENRSLQEEIEAKAAHVRSSEMLIGDLDAEYERAKKELEEIEKEVERQPMSVQMRDQKMSEIEYSMQVIECRTAQAKELDKTLQERTQQASRCKRRAFDAVAAYKTQLTHLATYRPHLGALARLDEWELRSAEFSAQVSAAVETLKKEEEQLAAQKAELARIKKTSSNNRYFALQNMRAKISEVKGCVEQEQRAREAELQRQRGAQAAWAQQRAALRAALAERHAFLQQDRSALHADLDFWRAQDAEWRYKLAEMQKYIETSEMKCDQALRESFDELMGLVKNFEAQLKIRVDRIVNKNK